MKQGQPYTSPPARTNQTVSERLGAGLAAYAQALLRDPCCYCGRPSEALDHIVPESQGGATTWDNLIGVCGSCNSSKRTSSLLGMLAWRLFAPERLRAEDVLARLRLFRSVGR